MTVTGGRVYVGDRAGGLVVLHSSAAFAAWQAERAIATARAGSERGPRPREDGRGMPPEAASASPWLDRLAGYAACWLGAMERDSSEGSILASWRSVLAAACSAATSPTATISSITPHSNNHIMRQTLRGAGFSPTAGR